MIFKEKSYRISFKNKKLKRIKKARKSIDDL
jgi:hypothetical protein